MGSGSLTIVGTGMCSLVQITPEAQFAIEKADKVLYGVSEKVTEIWILSKHRSAIPLSRHYKVGKPRLFTYRDMVTDIMGYVRKNLRVCVIFEGHPGVFVRAAHEAISLARKEGYEANMLPGISAEDLLFADLGVDPGLGIQSYESTIFLVASPNFDPRFHLVLWQIGAIAHLDIPKPGRVWDVNMGIEALSETLINTYGSKHEVVVYEGAIFPTCLPRMERVALSKLNKVSPITLSCTLYVPPIKNRMKQPPNFQMLKRFGMTKDSVNAIMQWKLPGKS